MDDARDTSRDGRLGNVCGALLIGGESSRMGRDKAAIDVGGESLAGRISHLLAAIVEDVVLVGGQAPPDAVGRHVDDAAGPRSSLRGLVSALASARAERVLVVATDMPLVTADLLLALTAWPEHDAVVPRRDGRANPLCALYRRDAVLPVARRKLAEGRLRLDGVLAEVDTSYLEGDLLEAIDPGGRALTNVNTPAELAALD